MEIRDLVLSHIKEGVILTDSRGVITFINKKSEEILGLRHQLHYRHDGGFLEEGDWILIADTALGVDDGGLTASDLESIGFDGVYRKNDGLLLWSQYKHKFCIYQTALQSQKTAPITISCSNMPIENTASIDFQNQKINIKIGEYSFEKSYKMAYGYLVVFSANGQLKFYQEDGYSIRQETIKQIIIGGQFHPKQETQVMSLIGQNIKTCFVDYHKLDHSNAYLINGIPVAINEQILKLGDETFKLYILEDVTELSHNRTLRDAALASLEQINRSLSAQYATFSQFLGISDSIKETMRYAQKASQVESNILITGESGTGKSLIAKEIHRASARRDKPFISVNCSSIPDALFESEMYGYVRGAFTGANTGGKIGYFEAANGGTLFLDEISELSLVNQAKLLHAIQEQCISRLGSVSTLQLDLRIIAATNKNLMEEIHIRSFREDLYYRLNVISIVIPPLRYRKEDIRYLAEKKFKSLSKKFPLKNPDAHERFISALQQLPLLGNVRELENHIERYLAIGEEPNMMMGATDRVENVAELGTYEKEMEAFEERLIRQMLAANGFNVKSTYELLQMKRSTFYDRLKKLRIEIPKK